MDTRPIGVFDSGLGGLTGVRELMKLLPNEDIIYLGDTGRVPYGNRSKETINKYTHEDVRFLKQFDPKAILIACGTVSTNVDIDAFSKQYDLPIMGVLYPAVECAVESSKSKKIGIIATSASIRSGAYERAIRKACPDAQILAEACPLFVPIVEAGRFQIGDPLPELLVSEYLAPFKANGTDTLILGCTHYPLLENVIAKFVGPDVKLISPGAEAAKKVAACIEPNTPDHKGSQEFYVSDSTESFSESASLFLQMPVEGTVEKISL